MPTVTVSASSPLGMRRGQAEYFATSEVMCVAFGLPLPGTHVASRAIVSERITIRGGTLGADRALPLLRSMREGGRADEGGSLENC